MAITAKFEAVSVACEDCGRPTPRDTGWGVFNGERIRPLCDRCGLATCRGERGGPDGPGPSNRLGEGWVIGHAARVGHVFTPGVSASAPEGFTLPADRRRQVFMRGCFQRCFPRLVVLGVNHAVCGREWRPDMTEAEEEELIAWPQVLASTRAGSLFLSEDPYGLFFAAWFRPDACVAERPGAEWVNIHEAIATGLCVGVSVRVNGGDKLAGPNVPPDLRAFVRAPLAELSLLLPPETGAGSPGTWVLPAGPAAMNELYSRLRGAAADLTEET